MTHTGLWISRELDGRMGFWAPPSDENRVIRNAEAENLSNDGAIFVTSPRKPSYLGYIGSRNWAMKIDGACHCGYITYRAEIDPGKVLICHCTDCQTLSGTAYRSVAFAKDGSFELLSGTLKAYIKIADSGNQRAQTFCPECGSPIYSGSPGDNPKNVGIRIGTCHQRDALRPTRRYWCGSAQAWSEDISALPKVEAQGASIDIVATEG